MPLIEVSCRTGEIVILSALILVAIAPITGSFLGTVVLRLPEGQSVVAPPSHCDACGHRLALLDLLPVVNWLLSRGRCRFCGAPVSAFYPAIEVAALVIALWSVTAASGWMLWATAVLGWVLLAIALIDLRRTAVPVGLALALIPLGLAVAWAGGSGLAAHLVGSAAGYGVGLAVCGAVTALGGRLDGGRALATVAAAAGAWVGWAGLLDVVAIAAAAALVWIAVRRMVTATGEPATHGLTAWLALGTWLAWLYGPLILA